MSRATQEVGGISPEVRERYEPIIGLEVHVQLKTQSKVFCACSTRFGDPPNSNTCPVCLGLPGSLPVLNRRALELAIRASLALNCAVRPHSRFARKNYFYPDLPKGYQISMYELPLATGGWLEIEHAGSRKRIGITRLHMEEDAAKALHEGFPDSDRKTYIDYNRCGVALIEIVSEPDIRAPEEAYTYLTTLKQVLEYTEVSDCDMEKGSLRCDANVSVRPRGAEALGTKAEVKNLNSFRYLQHALEHEIERQIGVLEAGGRVQQETRLWNLAAGRTEPMRSKEYAHDYRYFPEPDLLPVAVSEAWKEKIRGEIPELPAAKQERFLRDYAITPYDAGVLTATRTLADYFEAAVKAGAPAKSASNWIQTELLRRLNDAGKEIEASPVSPAALADLIALVEKGEITAAVGKKVFAKMFDTSRAPREIISAEGLEQIADQNAVEEIVSSVVRKEGEKLEQYRFGKESILKSLIGRVMKETRGRANPQRVTSALQLEHERAVAQSFVEQYKKQFGARLGAMRRGQPPEPDHVCFNGVEGKAIGLEVTTTYLHKEEARLEWQQAKTGNPPVFGVSGNDSDYLEALIGAVLRKKDKTYSTKPVWLVVDFDYPLGDDADAHAIAVLASKELRQRGAPWSFDEIWCVWRRTNVSAPEYRVFPLAGDVE